MARGKPEIDRAKCTGCARCVPVCAQKILVMSGKKRLWKKIFAYCTDADLCTGCGECAKVCPPRAIQVWSFNIVDG